MVFFLVVAAVGLAADLLSKHYAFSMLMDRPDQSVTLIAGLLKFNLSTNPGIVFGIRAPGWAILAATAAAVAAVVMLFATSPQKRFGLHAALAMILAGAMGNAYDRLLARVTFPGDTAVRVGQVRDFIDVHIHGYHWPTFNVADILLVVGVAVVLLESIRDMLRHRRKK